MTYITLFVGPKNLWCSQLASLSPPRGYYSPLVPKREATHSQETMSQAEPVHSLTSAACCGELGSPAFVDSCQASLTLVSTKHRTPMILTINSHFFLLGGSIDDNV